MTSTILYTADAGVATITLNRPEKLNTFTPQGLEEFDAAVRSAAGDAAVRVLVIRGAGRAFSAGYDMVAGAHNAPKTLDEDRESQVEHLRRWNSLRELPKPVIAMVHGYCLGGAVHLCVACDLVFAASDAVIGSPKIPAGAGFSETMWALSIGPQLAKYLSFVPGSEISGAEAAAMGFAARAFPPGELEQGTYAYARRAAKVPPDLMKIKKLSINRVMDMQGFRTAMDAGAEWNAIAHYSRGAEQVRETIKERGLRGAIDWYNA